MNAFSPVPAEMSFADVIALINETSLPAAKKTAWTCSLRMIAKGLGVPVEGIIGRWQAIVARVNRLHPDRCGMAAKTLANHKSNVKASLLYLTEKQGIPGRGQKLTADWSALRQLVPHRTDQSMLTALMRHASAMGVSPGAVNDVFVLEYLAYRRDVLCQDARPVVHRRIAKTWNACAIAHASWPQRLLTIPPTVDRGVIDWNDFPLSLRAEIDTWLDGMKVLRRFPGGTRRRPAKATTIRTRHSELKAYARRAVDLGTPLDDLVSLTALLDPDLVEKVFDQMCGYAAPKTALIDLSHRLHALAKDTGCQSTENLARLRDIRDLLEDQRKPGMTSKNLGVVRAVMTGNVWKKITELPEEMLAAARKLLKSSPQRAALQAQRAIGIAILTFMPIRIGNLSRLRIGTHLIRPDGVDGNFFLTVPDAEVKNRVTIECQFDEKLTALLDLYISDFRPHLMKSSNHDFLFPGRFGSARQIAALSARIGETVCKAVGIRVTAHQFRHAAAAFILRKRPGNYEFVRRILGHKSLKTTTEYYISLESTEAGRIFGEMLRENVNAEQNY